MFFSFLPIIHFLTGRKVLPDNYLFNDVATNLLTADKMTHFKMSNFQATWNHHSNLIPELYSLNSLFGFESSVDSLFYYNLNNSLPSLNYLLSSTFKIRY